VDPYFIVPVVERHLSASSVREPSSGVTKDGKVRSEVDSAELNERVRVAQDIPRKAILTAFTESMETSEGTCRYGSEFVGFEVAGFSPQGTG